MNVLPTFESDHRNGYHNGAPAMSCSICKTNGANVPLVKNDATKTNDAMKTNDATETFKPGDVIEDSYANPAVVLAVDKNGKPTRIMQTIGSDRGRITYVPRYIRRYTNEATIERAREVARDEWRSGRKWHVDTKEVR